MKSLASTGIVKLFLLIAVVSTFCFPVKAGQVVWQIGNFDKSSIEFGGAPAPAPAQTAGETPSDVTFVIGKSHTADWPAFQPGSANGLAGFRPHPYAIQFDLPAALRGLYTLKVAMLVECPRVARLEVAVNGHRALYFQHPELDYSGGDIASVFLPNYSADTVEAQIPTKYLKQGTNRLVLTANDDPATRDDITGSGIFYDAVSLEQDAAAKYLPREIAAQAQPTVFYVQKGTGLAELVDVYVRHNSPAQKAEVVLSVGGAKYTAKLASDWEFGEQKVEFAVPEFAAGAKGEIAVSLGGHARRFAVTLDPAKKWNFFLVPHTHLDVGYTDYQAKVAEAQSRTLDEAMQMIHDHPDFRFSPDGFWDVRQFLTERSDEQKQLLFEAVKDDKIFVPTVEANLLTGFPTAETLLRSLYPAFEFHQQHGGDANYADITDVPSYSWSYASVMAAAGLKYFFAGSDNYRAPVLLQGRLQEKSPFWWEGPDGGRILMWYSRHYHQMRSLFGLRPTLEGGHDSLPIFLQIYSRPEYKSDGVIIYGTQVENTDLFPQQATLVGDWNKVYAFPHLQYSGFADAMQYIAGQFGNDAIPVIRGDGGPYWEDGIASTARSAAVERRNEQRALAAEKFSTFISLINPRLRPDSAALKQLWNDMVLYDEHTWGDSRSTSNPESQESLRQLALKEEFASRARDRVDDLLWRSMAALADDISDPSNTLLVFNPLSWQRSSLVEFDLNKGLELVDLTTHQPVPYEILSTGPDYHHIRFMAQDVPSVGYKAYAIKPAAAPAAKPESTGETTMENQYYRVVLDPDSGSVKSIFDKELNKELVNAASPYRFNQYLYVTGADKAPNSVLRYGPTVPVPELTVHGAENGRLVSVTHQPFGIVARLEGQTVNTPKVETEVVLFDGQKKIEFINRVHKTQVYTKEAVYFAFPFALEHPQFRYETQNGFVDPSRDLLPGACKEWFSVQHWVSAEEGGAAVALVPIDASLVTLGDIFRGKWPEKFGDRSGTIFSYVMDNYWDTNYAAGQGGDFTFRYVLTSAGQLAPVGLSRLGWEEMTPAELDQITSQDKAIDSPRPLPAAQGSFVQVSRPDVVLVTWKMAEDGDGTVMRFLEVGGQAGNVDVQAPNINVKSAWSSDGLERKESQLETTAHGFSFSVKPFEIVTVRLDAAGNLR